jgi:hypothetical protein
MVKSEARRDEPFVGLGLQRELARSFRARRIIMLVERHGRLVPVGQPNGTDILVAAMLLASVHARLPPRHAYLSAAIPGAACLRVLLRTDRGAILVAPVFDRGVAIGAILVEGERGQEFGAHDLARLEEMVASDVAVMKAA